MTAYSFVKDEKWTDLYYLDTMNFATSLYDMKNCAAGVIYPRTRGWWGNFFRNKLQEHATLPSATILYHSIDQYLCTENQSYITSQNERNRTTGTSMPITFSWPPNMLSFKCVQQFGTSNTISTSCSVWSRCIALIYHLPIIQAAGLLCERGIGLFEYVLNSICWITWLTQNLKYRKCHVISTYIDSKAMILSVV